MSNPGLTTQPAFAATPGAPNTINMIGGSDAQGNYAPGMVPVDQNGSPTVLALDSTLLTANTMLTAILAHLSVVVLAASSARIGITTTDLTTPGTTNKVSLGTDIINAVLTPGSNIVGRVGFDLTTPGTTNKVSLGTDVINTVIAGASGGTDHSNAAPAALTVIGTLTVTVPGAFMIQNQSQYPMQAIFDNGANTATVVLLAAGGDNSPGGVAPPFPGFVGRIRVASTNAGAQYAGRAI